MNDSLENCIPYEDYMRMKFQTIPPHRMKEFLDSVTSKGQDEENEYTQPPNSVSQQRNPYTYLDNTDVAGSLLELARQVPSPLHHPSGNLTLKHPHPIHAHTEHNPHTPMQHDQQVKQRSSQLEMQPTLERQSAKYQRSSNVDERRPCSSGVPQPVKKRKFEFPSENNYTISHSVAQNMPSTVLALPSQVQQQSYVPVREELLTVDSSQLYGLVVPASSSEGGQLPNVDSWALFSNHSVCTDSQTVVRTRLSQDNNVKVEVEEMPVNIKLEQGTHTLEDNTNVPGKMGHDLGASNYSIQYINGHENVHMPVSVQDAVKIYPSAKYWEHQEVQREALQCSSPDPHLQIKIDPDLLSSLKPEEGAYFWKTWAQIKNEDLLKEGENSTPPGTGRRKPIIFGEDVLSVPIAELNYGLCLMTKEARQQDGSPYEADMLYYLFLCIQKHMFDNDRIDNIFADLYYSKFLERLHEVLKEWCPKVNPYGYVISSCITEDMLWKCKQLGAHSPTTLLFTLMFFNTKYFILETVEQHLQLSFSKITKQTRKNSGLGKEKYCTIRFLRLNGQSSAGQKEETYVEQLEDPDNPLKCPIRLYDFYRFKCPQTAKGPGEHFYLVPEPVVVPNSPIWYSTQPVSEQVMEQMLSRILLVKEIQESHASSRLTLYQ
ncbi:transcriptional regulator QRICH1-like [Lissotriton helveticus]